MVSRYTSNQLRTKWKTVPDRVSVEFLNQTAHGVYADAVTVCDAIRRPGDLREGDVSQGRYLIDANEWYIPKVRLTTRPTPGDVIRFTPDPDELIHAHAAGDWVIGKEGVGEANNLGCWRVHTVKPQIQEAISTTLTVYRPALAQDSEGAVVEGALTEIASDVPCALQEASTFGQYAVEVSGVLGKKQHPRLGRAFIPGLVLILPHDRAETADGRRWEIQAYDNIDVLGQYMSLQLRRLL